MKRTLKLILILLAAAALLTGTAWAETDPVDQFAQQFAQFQTEMTVPVREFDVLMEETFTRYPELYFYYNGASYRSVPEGLELTMNYRNTDAALEDCYVIHSRDQLMAAIGLTMADLESHLDYVIAPDCQLSDNDYQEVFQQLEDDYYMIRMGYFSYTRNSSYSEFGDSTLTYGSMDFFLWEGLDVSTLAQWRDETEAAVLNVASTLFAQDMPDYQKELLIHDYLVDNNRYDTLYMDDSVNHLAYSALVQGKTVCQGYSEAARLLLRAAGVPSQRLYGDAGGAHVWNCVQIGGEWYMLDITWDDPAAEDGSDLGIKQYDYFNITSEQLAQDHTWETGDYPVCTATAMNYDAVRAAVDADTNTYTDYSTDLVETQEQDREALLALLGGAVPASDTLEPDEQTNPDEATDTTTDPSAGLDETTPPVDPGTDSSPDLSSEPSDLSVDPDATSQPADPDQDLSPDPTDPSADPDGTTQPVDPDLLQRLGVVTTDDNTVTKTKERQTQGFTAGSLVLILVLLALSVGAIVLIIRLTMLKRVSEARTDRRIRRERKVTMMLDRRHRRVVRR